MSRKPRPTTRGQHIARPLPRRMLPSDAVFWYAEDVSPGMRSAIAGLFILEGLPDPARFRASVERGVSKTPRFRQKVVDAPYHLLPPEWIVDQHMDFDYHVRHKAVRSPGNERALLEEAAAIIATPLDRARPLWEVHLLEGLEGGRAAVLFKAHHSLVDGVGAVALLDVFTDASPKPKHAPMKRPEHEPEKGRSPLFSLVRDTVSGAASVARNTLGLAADAALKPAETLRRAAATARGAAGMIQDIGADSILDPICMQATGLNRRLDCWAVPMKDLRRARVALDATINDLVLTAVSGAMGMYHEHRSVYAESLRAMVPMSLRTENERSDLGNRVGMMNIKLPVGEADAATRLEIVKERTGVAKRDRRGALYPFLMRALVLAPGFVFKGFVKQTTEKVNLICTNIPGTPDRRYYAGVPVERIIPYAPIMERCPVSIALLSYQDHLEIGIASDPEAMPDHDKFGAMLADSFHEVIALAEAGKGGKPRARRGRPGAKAGKKPRA